MLDRLRRLVSGSDWRRTDAPFMEWAAFQVGRVAFWACVAIGVACALVEGYAIFLLPAGLTYWWFSVMTARFMQDFQDVRRSS